MFFSWNKLTNEGLTPEGIVLHFQLFLFFIIRYDMQ